MPPPPETEEPPIFTALPPTPPSFGPPGADDLQQPLYDGGASIVNDYVLDPGVCVLPLAEDPPTSDGELATYSPVVILRLHAPYRIRRMSYAARKQNNPPVVPTPDDTGKFIFLAGSITFTNGLNAGYANYDWQVNAEYVFVENCVSRTEDGFVLGSPPYNTNVEGQNANDYPSGKPTIGAISEAGMDALVGWRMMDTISPELNQGLYAYNNRSYFPKSFFSDDMVNS